MSGQTAKLDIESLSMKKFVKIGKKYEIYLAERKKSIYVFCFWRKKSTLKPHAYILGSSVEDSFVENEISLLLLKIVPCSRGRLNLT